MSAAQKPLRVLVNAAAVRTGGGGTFVFAQITALSSREDLDLTVVAAGDVAARLEHIDNIRVRRPPARATMPRMLWEHLVLSLQARHFDVLYCAGNFCLPLAWTPQVVTMQNALLFGAAARRFRRGCSRRLRLRLGLESLLARLSVRRGTCVIAISESLRASIAEDLGPRPNLCAIYAATPDLPAPRPPAEPRPYVLSVAHDHPHKGWDALVALFAEHPELPPLVAVGAFTAERRRRLEAVAGGRVRFRGTVRDRSELAGLYASAACCVVHSFVESFGLTALEALASDVPVIASDIPAHREVCGDAVAYYDPHDMSALGQSIRQVADTPRRACVLRSRSWTWEQNANKVASVLHDAADHTDSTTARKRARHDVAEN